jgi:hypothetical protein
VRRQRLGVPDDLRVTGPPERRIGGDASDVTTRRMCVIRSQTHPVTKNQQACDNLNHRRANAPVAHCPQCGGVVNASLRAARCDDARHLTARRTFAHYCVNCGTQLVAPMR